MRTFVIALALLLCASVSFAGEIEGTVSGIDTASATIEVSGVKINAKEAIFTKAATETASLADIAAGDKIVARGDFTAPALLKADSVTKMNDGFPAVRGSIDSIDTAARTIMISGIKVTVNADAMVWGSREEATVLDMLEPGYFVDCEGTWTGPAEFAAKSVKAD